MGDPSVLYADGEYTTWFTSGERTNAPGDETVHVYPHPDGGRVAYYSGSIGVEPREAEVSIGDSRGAGLWFGLRGTVAVGTPVIPRAVPDRAALSGGVRVRCSRAW
jgi:hypothetical protein